MTVALPHVPPTASGNPAADQLMLQMIVAPPPDSSRTAIDINYQQSPRTVKWAFINQLFRFIVRSRILRSDFALEMAHTEGGTVSQTLVVV